MIVSEEAKARRREYARNYYWKHREKIAAEKSSPIGKAKAKEYYRKNAEKKKAAARTYYKQNRDKILFKLHNASQDEKKARSDYYKQYYAEHKDKLKEKRVLKERENNK